MVLQFLHCFSTPNIPAALFFSSLVLPVESEVAMPRAKLRLTVLVEEKEDAYTSLQLLLRVVPSVFALNMSTQLEY